MLSTTVRETPVRFRGTSSGTGRAAAAAPLVPDGVPPKAWQQQGCIVLAAAVIFFIHLGTAGLWELDEPLYASCAREMLQRGDWIVPMYNGHVFFDKPPLMFWLMMASFKLFGISEFAARCCSPLLGIGTALATYHLGRLLFRAEVGFWAGLIVVSTLIFPVSARAATADSALTFFTTMAVLCFAMGRIAPRAGTAYKSTSQRSQENRGLSRFLWPGTMRSVVATKMGLSPSARRSPQKMVQSQNHGDGASDENAESPSPNLSPTQSGWLGFALSYAWMGLAVLTKGPIGVLLPAATIGLFLLLTDKRRPQLGNLGKEGGPNRLASRLVSWLRPFAPANLWRAIWQMHPLTAMAVVAAVALPWYVAVGVRTDGQWLVQFFAKYNVGPFLSASYGHHGPLFYHFLVIFIGFFPWSVFLGPTLWQTAKRIRECHAWRRGYVLMACWAGVFFAFWSLCSTKLPHYVLPAYPALALLTGCFLADRLAAPDRRTRWWLVSAAATISLVGIGMAVALPLAAAKHLPGEAGLGLVGLLLVLGGGLCLFCVARGRERQSVTVFAITSVVFVATLFGFTVLSVDRHQHARPLAAAIRQDSAARNATPPEVAGYRFLQACIVYYMGQSVPELQDAAALGHFLDHAKQPYLFTTTEHLAEIEQAFPGRLRVFSRRPRFVGHDEVFVLVPQGGRAANQSELPLD